MDGMGEDNEEETKVERREMIREGSGEETFFLALMYLFSFQCCFVIVY